MKLYIISIIPGHRGVDISTLLVDNIEQADFHGKLLAIDGLKVVHLLDSTGKIIKVYNK